MINKTSITKKQRNTRKPLNHNLFSGLVFRGSEYLPGDIILSLGNIREWAFKNRIIYDPEAQLIGEEGLKELNKHFVPEDRLAILIYLYKDNENNLCYLEYPYIPVKTLIKKNKQVEIVYWQLLPTNWDTNGIVEKYGKLYFGFWYPGINDEFISMSSAKLVVRKFYKLWQDLSSKYKSKIIGDGILDIEVDGAIKTNFFKIGRSFDVELKYTKELRG